MIRGHDANVAAFLAAARSDRLHHAWLLAGPAGIGKARFADRAALWLLADAAGPQPSGFEVGDDHPTARLIAAGSHPDHARLHRLTNDKTGVEARNIAVDQVRGLARLFATAPSFSARRAVVIDAIDDLEASAANALLKMLEEPPAGTVFLLVSHAPARLLPTIRSRTRTMRFAPLGDEALDAVLSEQSPDLSAPERRQLAAAAQGSPGRAMALAGLRIGEIDALLDRIAATGDPSNAHRVELARLLAGKAALPRYEAFLRRLPSRLAAMAREGEGEGAAAAIAAWDEARRIAAAAPRLALDPQATVFELAGLVAALAPARADA